MFGLLNKSKVVKVLNDRLKYQILTLKVLLEDFLPPNF